MFKSIKINISPQVETQALEMALYGAYIMYAKLTPSQSSQSVGLTFGLHLKKKTIPTNSFTMDFKKEFTIWFVNSVGNVIDYGIDRIASCLKLCGFNDIQELSEDMFDEEVIDRVVYNPEAKRFETKTETCQILRELTNKPINVLLQKSYNVYQGNLKIVYDINSFYDAKTQKSSTEIAKNVPANSWKQRLDYLIKNDEKMRAKALSRSQQTSSQSSAFNHNVENKSSNNDMEEIPF